MSHQNDARLDSHVLMDLLHNAGFRGAIRLVLYEYWDRSALTAGEWADGALDRPGVDRECAFSICECIRQELTTTGPLISAVEWTLREYERMVDLSTMLRAALPYLRMDPPQVPFPLSTPRVRPAEECTPYPHHRRSRARSASPPSTCNGPCAWCAGDSSGPSDSEDSPYSPGPPDPQNLCCRHRHVVKAHPQSPNPCALYANSPRVPSAE